MSPFASTPNDNISKVVAWLSALYPMLGYYGFGSLSFAIVLFFLILFYIYIKRQYIKFVFPIPVLCFYLYIFIVRFVFNLQNGNVIAFGAILIFLLWGFLNSELRISEFLNIYRFIVFVNIVFLVIQEFLYYTVGYRIIGIMTSLPLVIDGDSFDPQAYAETASLASRSSAFFSEPAHFAQYLLPLFAVELFYVGTRKAFFRCIIYFATLMILASGNALIGILVIFFFFLLQIMKKMSSIIALFVVVIIGALAIASYSYMKHTEYGEKIVERFGELEADQVEVSSGFVRVFRGFYIWKEMDTKEKIVGLIDSNRIKAKIRQCDVANTFGGDDDIYMSGWQSVMIYTGYLGTTIFIWIILWLWQGNTMAGRCCIALIVVLFCFAALYSTYTSVLYLALAFLIKKEYLCCKTIYLKIGK